MKYFLLALRCGYCKRMKPPYAEAAALMEMAGVNGKIVWTVVTVYCMFYASLWTR